MRDFTRYELQRVFHTIDKGKHGPWDPSMRKSKKNKESENTSHKGK